MAQLIGYSVINGSRAISHTFFAETETQQQIEEYRKELELKHNKRNKPDNMGITHYKNVLFTIRNAPGEKLTY